MSTTRRTFFKHAAALGAAATTTVVMGNVAEASPEEKRGLPDIELNQYRTVDEVIAAGIGAQDGDRTIKDISLKRFVTKDGLIIVGTPQDVQHIKVGDVMRIHLEMNGKVFSHFPHDRVAIVTRLYHDDGEYFYWNPVVAIVEQLGADGLDIDEDERAPAEEDPEPGVLQYRLFNLDHIRRI